VESINLTSCYPKKLQLSLGGYGHIISSTQNVSFWMKLKYGMRKNVRT